MEMSGLWEDDLVTITCELTYRTCRVRLQRLILFAARLFVLRVRDATGLNR